MIPDAPERLPEHMRATRGARWLLRALVAAVAGFGLAGILAINEYCRKGAMLWPSSGRIWTLLLAGLLAVFWGFLFRRRNRLKPESRSRLAAELPWALLAAAMVSFLCSGALLHPWTYFVRWLPHFGEGWHALTAQMPLWILLTAGLTPFFLRKQKRLGLWMLGLLLASQVLALGLLLHHTGGVAIYKDDHPSFLFRFWEFARTFPQYLNYNPYWNGGLVNAYCHTSGTGALGLLLYPLWKCLPTHQAYTPALGLAYIVIMPLLAVAALRIMRQSWTAAACAGLMALGVSRHFFLWLLHYGTVCAPMVASFTLLVAACLYRVFWLDRREKWLGAILVLSVGVLVQWPPGGLMALPIAVTCLLAWRRWTWPKIRFLLVSAGLVLVLAGRQIAVVLLKGGAVVTHVMGGESATDSVGLSEMIVRGFHFLVGHLQEAHPVILFFGFAGLMILSTRSIRRWFGPPLVVFMLIVGWGPQFKPNLELGRMAIPMMFLAVAPAAVGCDRLLRGSDRWWAPARAALVVLLVFGGWNVARLYGNDGHANYQLMHRELPAFADQLNQVVPEGARVLFAGAMVHHMNYGHVAYLPVLADREMMAVDYYHFPPSYVAYEYPPGIYNQTPEGVMEFAEFYNVTHIVTRVDRWREFFRLRPDLFEEVPGLNAYGTTTFRLNRDPSPFLRGSGSVEADFSRISVTVDDPDAESILCYNWAEGLSVPEPVELFPFEAGKEVTLIGVRPNGCASFDIRFRSWL